MQIFIFTTERTIWCSLHLSDYASHFSALYSDVCVYCWLPRAKSASTTVYTPFLCVQCNSQIKTTKKNIFTYLNFDISVKCVCAWVHGHHLRVCVCVCFICDFQSRFTYCLFLPFSLLCASLSYACQSKKRTNERTKYVFRILSKEIGKMAAHTQHTLHDVSCRQPHSVSNVYGNWLVRKNDKEQNQSDG